MGIPIRQAVAVSIVPGEAEDQGQQALPARLDAGAAVSLQPGVRRLRQDPAPGAGAQHLPDAGTVLGGGRGVRRARRLDRRWRTARASADRPRSWRGSSTRKKFVYLCTNAILLERWLPKLTPSPYLTISVHMDGMRELHDAMVDREGVFDKAVAAIREAKRRGFRVSTNTTVFADSKPEQMRAAVHLPHRRPATSMA